MPTQQLPFSQMKRMKKRPAGLGGGGGAGEVTYMGHTPASGGGALGLLLYGPALAMVLRSPYP